MTKWGIIGLGWLGKELQQELKKRGHSVWGTRRSDFEFDSNDFPTSAADVLFLNTPPLIQMPPDEYVDKVQTMAARVLFVSSTSAYGSNTGKITEATSPEPKTESAKWLVEVEKKLRYQYAERLTVIRPGGLIGADRHPIHSLSGRKNIADGNKRIHLIHRQDLIQIILAAADEKNCPIVNAVTPYHPTKREYYTAWAEKLNLPKPEFSDAQSGDREIESIILPQIYPNWKVPKLDR